MDVFDIRHANLLSITEALKPGRLQKEVALALGISASYLSQMVAGKKMGADTARKIEEAHGLPHGWLDQWHGDTVSGIAERPADYLVSASQNLRLNPETISAALRLVRLAFHNLDLEIDQEENGVPLAFAYEYLLKRDERSVTPDNVIDFSKKLADRLRGQDAAEQIPARVAGSTR